MKPIKIKPCKSLRLGYLIYWIVIITVIFELMSVIMSKSTYEYFMGNIVMLGFIGVGITVYVCAECLYQSYILINDNELIKYKGKKVIFKIRLDDIIALGYRKQSIKMCFLLPFSYIIGDPMCGVLSLRFNKSDIESERVFDSLFYIKTLTEEEMSTGLKEYCECLTKKEIDLISKKLNLSLKQVDINKKRIL